MLTLWIALGCYKNTVNLGPPPGVQTYETRKAFVFWGALPDAEVDMDAVCPQGVARIEEKQNFLDGTIACCSLGFVRTVSVKVTCADGAAFELVPNPMGGHWALPEEA